MTRDDIIRMAREAANIKCDCCLPHFDDGEEDEMGEFLVRFAALVAAHTLANIDPSKQMRYQEGVEAGRFAEREACAKVCENMAASLGESNIVGKAVNAAAFNIRSRT